MTFPRKAFLNVAGLLALALVTAALPPSSSSAQSAPTKESSPSGKILFQSTQGSDTPVNEIYTMEADGKRQTRLTYNEFDDTHPIWSPQGDRIAFLSDRGAGGYDIYLMNPDGTGERLLRDAANGGPLLTNNIEWSPDGSRIMYAVGGKIYVVEVMAPGGGYSTTPVQNVSATAPVGAFDSNATWSPDGYKLAFISKMSCATCFPDLFVMNADGSERKQLTFTYDAEFGPHWTPTGRIAYGSYRNDPPNAYVINVDGTGDGLLTTQVGEVGGPVWSPDGARVAFRSAGPDSVPRRGLYVMNADGSGLTFLTDEANGGGRILWSQDGTKIVAHSLNAENCIDVISLDSAGAGRRATNMTKTKKADEYAYSWQRRP